MHFAYWSHCSLDNVVAVLIVLLVATQSLVLTCFLQFLSNFYEGSYIMYNPTKTKISRRKNFAIWKAPFNFRSFQTAWLLRLFMSLYPDGVIAAVNNFSRLWLTLKQVSGPLPQPSHNTQCFVLLQQNPRYALEPFILNVETSSNSCNINLNNFL